MNGGLLHSRNCGGGAKMDIPGRSYAVVKDGVIM